MGSWLPWRKLASNPPAWIGLRSLWQARGLHALLLGLADDAGAIRLGKLGLQSLAGARMRRGQAGPIRAALFDALVTTGWAEVQRSCPVAALRGFTACLYHRREEWPNIGSERVTHL